MINYLISCIIWRQCLKSLNYVEFYEAVEIQDREKKILSELCVCGGRVGKTSLKALGAWRGRDRLTCNGLWERIRCLISLSEQTCKNSCSVPTSKATGSLVTRPTPGMSRY